MGHADRVFASHSPRNPVKAGPRARRYVSDRERPLARAAVYVRVSTEEQATVGASLADQWERGRALARSLGARHITRYEDAGVSGAHLERPALSRLLHDVAAGQYDVVIVLDPDRLARRLVHQLLLTEEIGRHAQLRFVQFDWQDTPDGRLFYALRGAIAEFERERIRQRTHMGRVHAALHGRIATPPHQAYGYRYDARRHRLVPDPLEAAVVQDIFRRYAEGLEGPTQIARALTRQEVPARHGGAWHPETVRRILRNPLYVGRLRQLGQWVPVPALISEALWHAANARADHLRRMSPGHPNLPQPLLTGLAACGVCGSPLVVHTIGPPGRRRRTYVCRSRRRGRPGPLCARLRYDAACLEHIVYYTVARWYAIHATPLGVELPLSRPVPLGRGETSADAASARARARILRLLRRGTVTEAEAERQLRELDALATAAHAPARPSNATADGAPGALPATLEPIAANNRRLLEHLGMRVVVGPGRRLAVTLTLPRPSPAR